MDLPHGDNEDLFNEKCNRSRSWCRRTFTKVNLGLRRCTRYTQVNIVHESGCAKTTHWSFQVVVRRRRMGAFREELTSLYQRALDPCAGAPIGQMEGVKFSIPPKSICPSKLCSTFHILHS